MRRLSIRKIRQLASSNPLELVRKIQANEFGDVDLRFAAEFLQFAPESLATTMLANLLKHKSPLVRKGAVYGLDCYGREGQLTLTGVLRNDPAETVRDAAWEKLSLGCPASRDNSLHPYR